MPGCAGAHGALWLLKRAKQRHGVVLLQPLCGVAL
jgi:hypothetical protein